MRQTIVLKVLAGLVILGPAALAADPELLNMVMPEAKLLAGMNAGSTFMSPFGQFLAARLASLDTESQKFTAVTGFDPLQDMSEVLFAATGDGGKPVGLLLVRGKFDADKMMAAVAANLSRTQVQSYAGTTVLSGMNSKTNTVQALAFIGNSIAVSGDLAAVKAALDRNRAAQGSAQGTRSAIDPALLAQANQLSATEDDWLVSSGSVASRLPPNTPVPAGPAAQMLPILKNIQFFTGGFKFGTNVQMTAQALTSDAGNATALAALVKLGVTFISAMGGNNAQLNGLTQLLQAIEVNTNRSTVNLSLAIPEAQLETLLNQVLKPTTPGLRARLQSPGLPNGN